MKTLISIIHFAAVATFGLATLSNIASAAESFSKARPAALYHQHAGVPAAAGYAWMHK